ncbi:hypothetical protein DICSQDRAFT_154493 [Dichomitus squalens LYAD-421 SS1]|uniref:uncharacterized protein n=1 Tax=Dichomitus squalens (strain LYAD-421) TaxID=732165 RepID=UPI0004411C8A|nr:uncharacterized protein DICSQDRAFT_154493 [Dichomitus squalens LYAD-421 SS1]EJF62666.1 hypothetical protein DICSQDRAFT_154493 [Dichomitus squalens LYAD-421 SS1]
MNINWGVDIIDFVDIPNALTCARCKKDGLSKQDLKRCGGCRAAMYCSRDCQRGDWPSHRPLCRPGSVDTGAQAVGYRASMSLANTVRDWANVHRETFSTIVHALVRSAGGVERVLKDEEGVFVHLRPLQRVFDNPATAFEITSLSLLNKHVRSEPIFVQWEEPQKSYRESLAASQARRNTNSRLAGMIPVTYVVEGTDLVVHSQETLYRPNFHASDCPVDELTAAAFKDILSLCIRCVSTGLVLRASLGSDSVVPDAGYMVRQKKTWEWKRSEDLEALMLALISSDDVSRHTSLSIKQLWALWKIW